MEELTMIIEIRANNCFIFEEPIIFSMKADMRNKKFGTNVYRENNFNVLKVAGVYGANNAGKTCLIKCIRSIKHILLNEKKTIMSNMFSKNTVSDLGITFLEKGREYKFDVSYNTESEEYVSEKFSEIEKDQYGNEKEIVWFERDNKNNRYFSSDEDLLPMMQLISKKNLLCYLIDTDKFKYLAEMKEIITCFAKKMDIINMNNIPIQKTIDLMKNKSDVQQKVVDFIKNADLYMENFLYSDIDKIKIKNEGTHEKPEEEVLDIPENIMDKIRLTSVYKGVSVPSMLFDSTGTKKIAALASYIVEGIQQGKILIVDELDSSIHFKLTRAIVAMFNNELNTNAQLIFTVHDINLMDCKKMFRKEQIWFVHKDNEGVYVYSLADFTAQDGIRDTTDIMEKYRKGLLGALPNPELMYSLLDLKGNKRG